jgi:hypothetical protein
MKRSRVVCDEKFQEMDVIIQITTFSVVSCFQNCNDRKKLLCSLFCLVMRYLVT